MGTRLRVHRGGWVGVDSEEHMNMSKLSRPPSNHNCAPSGMFISQVCTFCYETTGTTAERWHTDYIKVFLLVFLFCVNEAPRCSHRHRSTH